jgi:hypothetical protein
MIDAGTKKKDRKERAMISRPISEKVFKPSNTPGVDEGRRLLEHWDRLNSAASSQPQTNHMDDRRPAPEMPMRNFMRVVFTR